MVKFRHNTMNPSAWNKGITNAEEKFPFSIFLPRRMIWAGLDRVFKAAREFVCVCVSDNVENLEHSTSGIWVGFAPTLSQLWVSPWSLHSRVSSFMYPRVWRRSCSSCPWCCGVRTGPWAGRRLSLSCSDQARSSAGWRTWPQGKGIRESRGGF